jgi:hypothetical protein
MFLGARVDDALTLYYRRQLDHGDKLGVEQVADAYRDRWQAELVTANNDRGVDWDDGLDEARAFELGLDAVALTFSELVPSRCGASCSRLRRTSSGRSSAIWILRPNAPTSAASRGAR